MVYLRIVCFGGTPVGDPGVVSQWRGLGGTKWFRCCDRGLDDAPEEVVGQLGEHASGEGLVEIGRKAEKAAKK